MKFSDVDMENNYQDELDRIDLSLRQVFLRGYQMALRDINDGKDIDKLQFISTHQETTP